MLDAAHEVENDLADQDDDPTGRNQQSVKFPRKLSKRVRLAAVFLDRTAAAALAVARVRVDDGMYAAAVPADELGALVGRQLAEPIHPQQMVVRQQVSARPLIGPDQVALTIPVNPASAAGGRVRPGDSVA